MSACELAVADRLDPAAPHRRIGVLVSALDRAVGISNTTEHPVRIVIGGEARVLWPSPQRAECLLIGIVLWRASEPFDFRAVGESSLPDAPVELDALCVELLLPGDPPTERPH